jgi:very-short-patch-repair endonuclease/predicted transcriptional regulator of viral defense system
MLAGMEGVGHVGGEIVHFRARPPIDHLIAALAERQHGVVGLAQLRRLGLSKDAVAKRVRAGRMRRIHRGVYAVGHGRLTAAGRIMAAVLACGPGACASHRTAAGLLGIRADNRPRTDVTVPGRSVRPRPGIDVHRSVTLTPADCKIVDGIRCTTVARTLLDLAEVVDRRGLERAIEQAEVLRVFDLRAVEKVLARADGRRGAAVLRTALAGFGAPALTESDLEERFLRLCRAAQLPAPKVNAWLAFDDEPAVKVDFLWRHERVAVETDGYEAHGTRQAFERDRMRDQRLKRAGYEPVRFTWRQIAERPGWVSETVAALVRRAAAGAR